MGNNSKIVEIELNLKKIIRAITKYLNEKEIWFLHTALLLNVIYLYVKFEVTSFYTLEVMPQTKINNRNLQRAITRNRNGIEL